MRLRSAEYTHCNNVIPAVRRMQHPERIQAGTKL